MKHLAECNEDIQQAVEPYDCNNVNGTGKSLHNSYCSSNKKRNITKFLQVLVIIGWQHYIAV
jgi:hypothetical protein